MPTSRISSLVWRSRVLGDGHLLTNICLCRRIETSPQARRRGVLAGICVFSNVPWAPQNATDHLYTTQLLRSTIAPAKNGGEEAELRGAILAVCAHFTPSPTRGKACWTHMLATPWTLFDFICRLVALGGRPLKQSESPRWTPRSLMMASRGACT